MKRIKFVNADFMVGLLFMNIVCITLMTRWFNAFAGVFAIITLLLDFYVILAISLNDVGK